MLSGGGARGAAEIGALRVLEELHIVPDLIVGTSIGSIVGGLYATGWTPDEIEELLKTMDWSKLFSDRVDRRERTFRRKQDDVIILIQGHVNFDGFKPYLPPGILGGQSMELFMKSLEIRSTGETDFDAFPIPYRAVATNLNTGEPLVFARGSLATAMRASMAIPGLFAPVEHDGVRLSDGGAVANLPIGIARAQGAEAVIAVDISSPLNPFPQESASFIDSINRMNSLLTVSNRSEDVGRLKPGDVFIQPDLTGLSFLAFDKAAEAVGKGYEAARAKISELKRFSASDEEWAAFRARHHRRPESDLVVNSVRVENTSGLDDRLVRQAISVPVGQPLDLPALNDELLRLNAMNVFGLIRDGLDRKDGRSELVITTPAKERGLGTLQAGINLTGDFQGDSTYSVTLVHRLLAMNRLNGEWQNVVQFGNTAVFSSRFYQPLDTGQHWFVSPLVEARQELQGFWVDGNQVARYRLEREQARLGFGRVLGNWGELRVDAYSASNRAILQTGTQLFPDVGVHTGGVEGTFRVDTLDSTVFPTEGTLLTASYDVSLDSLGADTSYHTAFAFGGTCVDHGQEHRRGSAPGRQQLRLPDDAVQPLPPRRPRLPYGVRGQRVDRAENGARAPHVLPAAREARRVEPPHPRVRRGVAGSGQRVCEGPAGDLEHGALERRPLCRDPDADRTGGPGRRFRRGRHHALARGDRPEDLVPRGPQHRCFTHRARRATWWHRRAGEGATRTASCQKVRGPVLLVSPDRSGTTPR